MSICIGPWVYTMGVGRRRPKHLQNKVTPPEILTNRRTKPRDKTNTHPSFIPPRTALLARTNTLLDTFTPPPVHTPSWHSYTGTSVFFQQIPVGQRDTLLNQPSRASPLHSYCWWRCAEGENKKRKNKMNFRKDLCSVFTTFRGAIDIRYQCMQVHVSLLVLISQSHFTFIKTHIHIPDFESVEVTLYVRETAYSMRFWTVKPGVSECHCCS